MAVIHLIAADDIGVLGDFQEMKKKQIRINHIQEGIGHGGQPAGQVEGQQ
jgi:hypothetical protein